MTKKEFIEAKVKETLNTLEELLQDQEIYVKESIHEDIQFGSTDELYAELGGSLDLDREDNFDTIIEEILNETYYALQNTKDNYTY